MNLFFTDSIGFLVNNPLQKLFFNFSKIQSFNASFSTFKTTVLNNSIISCEKLIFTNNILITIDDNRNIFHSAPYFKSF